MDAGRGGAAPAEDSGAGAPGGGPGGRVLEVLGPSAGGIRRHVACLAEGLPALGWDVRVAGPGGVMGGVGRQDHDVAVALDPWAAVTGRRALARALASGGRGGGRRPPVDVLHAHGLKAGWLAASLRRRPPLVVTVHNLVLDEAAGRAARPLRALEAALPARVDRVVAVSAEIARRFTGHVGADRVVVVPPAGPPPRPTRPPAQVRAALGVAPWEQLVVTVARLHPQKDLGTLLEAAAALVRAAPAARWVVVGEGPQRAELEARATALGLDGVVRFVGASANAADELAAADVVALTSRWEGSPLVVAEALQLGVPVVATAVGAVPEVVRDGRTGRLVPSGDPAALAAAVGDVLADPTAAAVLAAAGRAAATERFATERLVAAVAEVYAGLRVGGRR